MGLWICKNFEWIAKRKLRKLEILKLHRLAVLCCRDSVSIFVYIQYIYVIGFRLLEKPETLALVVARMFPFCSWANGLMEVGSWSHGTVSKRNEWQVCCTERELCMTSFKPILWHSRPWIFLFFFCVPFTVIN